MVVGRDGKLLNILRIGLTTSCQLSHGIAVALEADENDPEKALQFHKFIELPSGSNSKTHIVYDEVSDHYIAIGNICVHPETPAQRNVLALQYSKDLYMTHRIRDFRRLIR